VSQLRTSDILPLPAYLFEGESPFLGVLAGPGQQAEASRASGAVFLLAGPDRLSRSAAGA
jgi:hypothetical protein